MERGHGKSGLKLVIGLLSLLMMVCAGGSYAQTSFKNTPLYKHLIKKQSTKPTVQIEAKPVSAGSALPRIAQLLPPDTAVVVSIGKFSEFKAQFEKTDLFKLYKDPSMAAFIDKLKTNLREKTGSGLAAMISDSAVLPEGRAAVALVLNEITIDADQPPTIFIAEWGERAAQAKEIVEKMMSEGGGEGQIRRQTEDYNGILITSIAGQSDSTSYCFIDETMILSSDAEIMKFVIAQAKGAGNPTLADDDVYNSTLKAVSSSDPGQIDVYVNIQRIIQAMAARNENGEIKGILTRLGLDNVTSFALSFNVAATSGKAILKIDGARKGICKLLEFESNPVRVPQFVPASANSVSFVNLNMKKVFDEAVKILTAFSPEMAMMVNMPLSQPGPGGEPPLQLKTGIIDHLGSQIVVAQSMQRPASGADTQSMPKPDSLIAMEVTNRAPLEKALLSIHSTMLAPGDPDARRGLLGHTIYRIDLFSLMFGMGGGLEDTGQMQAPGGAEMPGMPEMEMPDMNMPEMEMEMGMPEMPALAFTVTDTHLIFGSEDSVERAIRTLRSSSGRSLASAKWFAQANAAIPSAVGFASLQNSEAFAEFAWSKLRSTEMTDESEPGPLNMFVFGGASPEQLLLSLTGADQIDFSLLPDFDAVRKYFGLSASYGIATQDGFFFEFKYINPQ